MDLRAAKVGSRKCEKEVNKRQFEKDRWSNRDLLLRYLQEKQREVLRWKVEMLSPNQSPRAGSGSRRRRSAQPLLFAAWRPISTRSLDGSYDAYDADSHDFMAAL